MCIRDRAYHHQVKACAEAPSYLERIADGSVDSMGGQLVAGLEPVSYTHLDVYKRQHQLLVPVNERLAGLRYDEAGLFPLDQVHQGKQGEPQA